MYNIIEVQKVFLGFVVFWFFFFSFVNLGLIKFFIGFLWFIDKLIFFRLQWLIIMVVVVVFILVIFVVLCVLYVNNIFVFVIFICFFYYVLFMIMWIFDGLRLYYFCFKNKLMNDRVEMVDFIWIVDLLYVQIK